MGWKDFMEVYLPLLRILLFSTSALSTSQSLLSWPSVASGDGSNVVHSQGGVEGSHFWANSYSLHLPENVHQLCSFCTWAMKLTLCSPSVILGSLYGKLDLLNASWQKPIPGGLVEAFSEVCLWHVYFLILMPVLSSHYFSCRFPQLLSNWSACPYISHQCL